MEVENWYLLYDGTPCEDGDCGAEVYIGRTTDENVAWAHYRACRQNPLSTGYVVCVTDNSDNRLTEDNGN